MFRRKLAPDLTLGVKRVSAKVGTGFASECGSSVLLKDIRCRQRRAVRWRVPFDAVVLVGCDAAAGGPVDTPARIQNDRRISQRDVGVGTIGQNARTATARSPNAIP